MDPAGRQEVLELARDLAHNKGMSLLFSSHLLPDVEAVCDYVIVLGGGKLLAEGKIQELKQVHRAVLRRATQGRHEPFARRLDEPGLRDRPSATICCVCGSRRAQSPQLLWEAAAARGRANSLLAAAAQHARRSVPRCRERCRSTPDANLRSRLSTLVGRARRATPGVGWRSRGTACGLRSRGRTIRLVLFVAGCRRSCWHLCFALWGLVERKSDLIASIMPMLGFLDPEILAGPRYYRVEIWTICFNYFLRTETVVFDGAHSAGRARISSARTCATTRCRCISRGRCGGSTTSSASWA